MMRTTVDIPDDLYAALKMQALEEKTSIKGLLTEGARLVRSRQINLKEKKRSPFPIIRANSNHVITSEMVYEHADFP